MTQNQIPYRINPMTAQKITTQQVKIELEGLHTLDARLDSPEEGQQKGFAVFAHCFSCSKSFKTTVELARALAARGFGVLRIDFTGLGKSDGDFSDTNFSTNVQDILAGVQWLRENHEAPTLIYGHSFGGTAALAAAEKTPEVKAVATVNAPFEPRHVLHNFGCDVEKIVAEGEREVALAGRPFVIKKQFIEDIQNYDMDKTVRDLDKHLLIFHAPEDETVSIDNARHIYEAAKHPKSFIALPGADHFLKEEKDAAYVGQTIAAWANRYARQPL